jgi:hypothetical protein
VRTASPPWSAYRTPPSQAVGDGVFVVSVQVEEPADFGERQWDQASPYP